MDEVEVVEGMNGHDAQAAIVQRWTKGRPKRLWGWKKKTSDEVDKPWARNAARGH